jgi:hypothetical protein
VWQAAIATAKNKPPSLEFCENSYALPANSRGCYLVGGFASGRNRIIAVCRRADLVD